MIDFKKKVDKGALSVVTDPIAIYGKLDRASDKGELRQVQRATLEEWRDKHRAAKDLIIKLHTGQGKTLIGLLILQSQLNAGKGPALYLSPNNFLVDQTKKQAEQFGIRTVTTDGDLPDNFTNSEAILVTSVKKLFNGRTKFGIGRRSVAVGSIVVDDAHASIEEIRETFTILLKCDSQPFKELFDLFRSDLEQQGVGTFADLLRGERDALLPVPYWAWMERHSEVAGILSASAEANEIKFAWPLIKDNLLAFTCIFSGTQAQIFCNAPTLSLFRSFESAGHRVYMSATTADDSFLVKGLGLSKATIESPLTYEKEKWSGERMILIPSLISEELNRGAIVERFGKTREKPDIGVVVLTPSFPRTTDWQSYGAFIANRDSIYEAVDRLKDPKRGSRLQTVVFANRYEGIDLPDASCRILILDSKPWGESLQDRYLERCLEDSRLTAMKTARTIEQGLGRAVRGEKDFCVVLIIGPDLVREVRRKDALPFYSKQTQRQIEIGLEIAELAKEELERESPSKVLTRLVNQSLRRDEGWKAYYVEEMNKVEASVVINNERLAIYEQERISEEQFQKGQYRKAVETMQHLLDTAKLDNPERGWYLQEAAR
jgi:replicative superfamily II helicase